MGRWIAERLNRMDGCVRFSSLKAEQGHFTLRLDWDPGGSRGPRTADGFPLSRE